MGGRDLKNTLLQSHNDMMTSYSHDVRSEMWSERGGFVFQDDLITTKKSRAFIL